VNWKWKQIGSCEWGRSDYRGPDCVAALDNQGDERDWASIDPPEVDIGEVAAWQLPTAVPIDSLSASLKFSCNSMTSFFVLASYSSSSITRHSTNSRGRKLSKALSRSRTRTSISRLTHYVVTKWLLHRNQMLSRNVRIRQWWAKSYLKTLLTVSQTKTF